MLINANGHIEPYRPRNNISKTGAHGTVHDLAIGGVSVGRIWKMKTHRARPWAAISTRGIRTLSYHKNAEDAATLLLHEAGAPFELIVALLAFFDLMRVRKSQYYCLPWVGARRRHPRKISFIKVAANGRMHFVRRTQTQAVGLCV